VRGMAGVLIVVVMPLLRSEVRNDSYVFVSADVYPAHPSCVPLLALTDAMSSPGAPGLATKVALLPLDGVPTFVWQEELCPQLTTWSWMSKGLDVVPVSVPLDTARHALDPSTYQARRALLLTLCCPRRTCDHPC
jgi:hypothetical protein